MVRQLVIARKDFLNGLSFECNMERNQYILNYLDLGSIPLRVLKTFSYRKLESFIPIEDNVLKRTFTENLEQGTDHHSVCFCIDKGIFIYPGSKEAALISNIINDYVGTIFQNYY